MKTLVLFCVTLILYIDTAVGQGGCSCCNNKIISPVVSMPTGAGIISSTCSTLVVKWRGDANQGYEVSGTFSAYCVL
jgi:hypothetical protein